MSNLTEALSYMRLLIDRGKYEKNIEEPTPLEKKCILVEEVKQDFFDDLFIGQGLDLLVTFKLAWDLAEIEVGADEALNKGFLYTVVNYISTLETFYLERRQVDKNCAYWE